MVRPLAKRYEEYLNFMTVDVLEYPEMVPAMGLPKGAKHGIVVQNPAVGQIFPMRNVKGLTPEKIDAWIVDISSGKVKPWDGTPVAAEAVGHDEL